MKQFKLKRVMQYTEYIEVVVESWNDAKAILDSDEEFIRNEDDSVIDSSIEYLGEVT